MNQRATGSFEVSMKPQAEPEKSARVTLGRMILEKKFMGDLVGSGKGEMLTAVTEIQGSAGYVAIERFTGTLQGRQGSFIFQHSGLMTRGAQQLSITVVPDSGTDQLSGLRGQFKINITNGKHLYEFEYSLP